MINGGCVWGYLASLVKLFWNQGVRQAPGDLLLLSNDTWKNQADADSREDLMTAGSFSRAAVLLQLLI
jgi:hypothetical protein